MTRRTVWLASYPKSGNTWFRAVAVAWARGEPVDLQRLRAPGIGSIASSRARIETALGIPTSLMTADEVDLLRPRADEVTMGWWSRPGAAAPDDDADDDEVTGDPGGRRSLVQLTKVHDALLWGPSGEPIVSMAATRSAIYVVRDPRDVVLSLANHNGWPHERAVDAIADSDHAMAAQTDRIPEQVRQRLGTWSEHVRSWVDQDRFPVHVVRYEDCHRAPVETFTAALRSAGFDAAAPDVRAAVDAAAFERLAAQEAADGFRERPAKSERFFRRGVAGAWRDELAPELAARVEADHAEVMARFGYGPGEDLQS